MRVSGFKNLLIAIKEEDLKSLKILRNSKKTFYHLNNFIKESFQPTGKTKTLLKEYSKK
jgi:hypothetical protein